MHLPLRSLARYLFATCSIMTVVANPAWISSSAAAAVIGKFAFTGSITGSMAVQAGACSDGLGLVPASSLTATAPGGFGSPVLGGAGLGQGQARVTTPPGAATAANSEPAKPLGFDSQLTGHVTLPVGPISAWGYPSSSISLDISSGTLAPQTAANGSVTSMTTNTREKGYATLDIYVGSVDENYLWTSANGSIVSNGGSGSINIAMVPEPDVGASANGTIPGPGDVHIRGSWDC
jgi:hypothetical protein